MELTLRVVQVEMAEVETGLLLRKAQEAEAEIARIREENAKSESEKRLLEIKVCVI